MHIVCDFSRIRSKNDNFYPLPKYINIGKFSISFIFKKKKFRKICQKTPFLKYLRTGTIFLFLTPPSFFQETPADIGESKMFAYRKKKDVPERVPSSVRLFYGFNIP